MSCNSEKIRLLEERDLDAVLELRNQNAEWFFGGAVTPESHRKWFAEYNRIKVAFYVIEVEDQVIGTVSFTQRDDGIEVGNLTLDAKHRGKGIMQRAIQSLIKPGCEYYGRILANNEKSLRVFEKCGFKPHSVKVTLLQPS